MKHPRKHDDDENEASRDEDDDHGVPDGPKSWRDRHGPSLFVAGCLATLVLLMVFQSGC
ncbi:MAG TPA: hypothetical protein VK698_13260 [Kofleriaceae bacterium]|nr:hypothetical protein [Kofleriaceae bacterium]